MKTPQYLFTDTEVLPRIDWDPDEREAFVSRVLSSRPRWKAEQDPDPDPERIWRDTALDWRYGRVWLWSFAFDGEGPRVVEAAYHPGDDARECDQLEKMMLEEFSRLTVGTLSKHTIWVGHNLVYDLKMLYMRALRYKLYELAKLIPHLMWDKRAKDTMKLASGIDPRGFVSLDDLAEFLGTQRKTEGVDGSKVYDLWLAGRTGEGKKYVRNDVVMARDVFREFWQSGI